MTSLLAVTDLLNTTLDDTYIIAKIRDILSEIRENVGIDVKIEVEDRFLDFPIESKIHILTKALFLEREGLGFGTCCRVLAAIGDLRIEHGVPEASKCFVTLIFDTRLDLITYDLHIEWR